MKRLVLLCRHGNTFSKGEPVVMVGANEDLPLTEFGREQALRVGDVIKRSGLTVGRVVSGPLRRTREYLEIIVATAQIAEPIVVDSRLLELDYGAWGGCSDEEIARRWGAEVLRRWHEESIRPEDVPFIPSQEALHSECRSFLADLAGGPPVSVVVTSNGRLREFGRILSPTLPQSHKVRTGGSCLVEWSAGRWNILGWDCEPEELSRLLSSCAV
jgi:broad specificity phosphatase PhoE